MSHHELLEYIRQAKGTGANDKEIADRLHAAGWYRVDIQDALELYRTLIEAPHDAHMSVPRPSLTDRVVPRHYDLEILVVAVLSFIVGFVIYWIFTK